MKRKRDVECCHWRSLLKETLPEIRGHVYSFLEAPALARLAQTARLFEQELMRLQSGLLYYPAHWRKSMEKIARMDCHGSSTVKVGDLLRDVLLWKSRLNVLAGLGGGHCFVRLRVFQSDETPVTIFRIADNCDFKFCLQSDGRISLVSLPRPEDIEAVRKEARARHTRKLEHDRRMRRLSPETRLERARLQEEDRRLTKSIFQMERDIRNPALNLGMRVALIDTIDELQERYNRTQARLREIEAAIMNS